MKRLDELRLQAASCRNCDLWKDATQTVFGEGKASARLMVVGEQPGDVEDVEGRPFVGPAGRLLQRAFAEAGIDREKLYLTNAVKHFKFEMRGKRRLHRKPAVAQIEACKPWLLAEIEAVQPVLIVALGATAARALFGRPFKVTQHRGEVFHPDGLPPVTVIAHPSSILRAQDEDSRHEGMRNLVEDLRRVKGSLAGPSTKVDSS